jgi:signal recognition particle subunit SRP14
MRLAADQFLKDVQHMVEETRTKGSVWLTMKPYRGEPKCQRGAAVFDTAPEQHAVLLRATNGKKTVSLIVPEADVSKVHKSVSALLSSCSLSSSSAHQS